jgi:hypothetical protein
MSYVPKSNNPIAPSSWQKEVQRCIGISALEEVYGGKSMKKVDMINKIFELFHGTNDEHNRSYVSLCLNGENQFAHLWDKKRNGKLVMKESLSRSSVKFTSKVSFTKDSLSRAKHTSPALITGRTLHYNATTMTLRNLKKAQAFAIEFCGNPEEDYPYPSGKNEDDLDEYVLDKMYTELCSQKDGKAGNEENEDNDDEEEDDEIKEGGKDGGRDPGWIFPGWLAFKCFGLKGPDPKHRMSLLSLGDYKGNDAGRSGCRSENIKKKEEIREFQNNKRGVPTGAAKDAAIIAQEDMRSEESHLQNKMLAVTSLMNTTTKEIASTVTLLQTFKEGTVMHEEALKDYKALKINLTKFKTQLEELSSVERRVPETVESFLCIPQAKRQKQSSTTQDAETPVKNVQI